jgi:hypothetical protein
MDMIPVHILGGEGLEDIDAYEYMPTCMIPKVGDKVMYPDTDDGGPVVVTELMWCFGEKKLILCVDTEEQAAAMFKSREKKAKAVV